MTTNRLDNDKKRNIVRDANEKANSRENPEKKKNINEGTRNTGFRSSRIRDKESRTSDAGDPSVSYPGGPKSHQRTRHPLLDLSWPLQKKCARSEKRW